MALLSPHTFFTHVPAPGELVGGLAVQPPEHGAVHVGGVDLHGPEHLAGGGEGEAVADLEALADEAAALQPSVQENLWPRCVSWATQGSCLPCSWRFARFCSPVFLPTRNISLDLVFTGSGSQENSILFWSPKEAAKSSWRRTGEICDKLDIKSCDETTHSKDDFRKYVTRV